MRPWYDAPAQLNVALNELYNLIFDGGLGSVWGVRQVRRDLLEDPNDVASGIPPHKTLAVKGEVPDGVKVVETVAQGQIPPDAMNLYHLVDREFQQSSLTNDVRLGNLPPRRVKATEIIESQQGQSVTIDSLLKDVENEFIEPLIRKCWLTLLQFADHVPLDQYEGAVDAQTALTFASMTRVDRFLYYKQFVCVQGLWTVTGIEQDTRLSETRDDFTSGRRQSGFVTSIRPTIFTLQDCSVVDGVT